MKTQGRPCRQVRSLALAVLALLAAPSVLATHPVAMDPATLAKAGAEIVVFVDVNGAYKGSAQMDLRQEDDVYTYSSQWRGSYSWSTTAFLQAKPEPDAAGWTHEGSTYANSTMTWDDRGSGVSRHSVGEEYEWQTTSEHTCVGSGLNRLYPKVLAKLTERGTVLVRFENMQWNGANSIRFECRASDTDNKGVTTEQPRVGPGALVNAPLLEGSKTREELAHLDVELALGTARQTFFGEYSGGGSEPRARDEAFAYCGEREESITKSCNGSGTVEAILYIDPCETIGKSYEKHLADVQALKPPPKGSSESQVRAFSVDVRMRTQALLSDARRLELMCDGGTEGALPAVAEAMRALADAWFDVARVHGLSQDGVRDALAAERAAQLAGAEPGNGPADLAPPGPSGNTASVKVHSPVALHAWDEEGRHVGWNAAIGAPDLEIPNASFTGEAGQAQTLMLPEGVYLVAVDELGPGTYALNMSTPDLGDITPLHASAGGASSFVLLVDHEGAMTFASARGAQKPGYIAPSALQSTVDVPATSGPGRVDAGAPSEKGSPFVGPGLLVVLLSVLALARRRG